MSEEETFYDPEFLRKLESLSLHLKKATMGRYRGRARSRRYGASPEFAGHREYRPGDDPRYLDWSLYGRLDKLFLKLFSHEEELFVHILIDRSGSMGYGLPTKLTYARRLAAALGYLGLANLDWVGAASFAEGIGDRLPPRRGRKQLAVLFDFLRRLKGAGETEINRSLRAYAGQARYPGLAIVISDFLAPDGYEEGLSYLAYQGFEVSVVQLLSPDEEMPQLDGPVTLRDVESGRKQQIMVDKQARDRYQQRLQDFKDRLRDFCRHRRMIYLEVSTALPFERVILNYLRQ